MTGALRIRAATPADAPTLAAVGAATFTETFGHLYRPADLAAFLAEKHCAAAYEQAFAAPDYAAWLALTPTGEAAGYVTAGPCDLPVPDRPDSAGELQRLYLSRVHHGGGAGTRLLETALAFLEPRFDWLYISVYSENFGAQRLYARYGFEKICEYDYMVGDHADPEFILARPARRGDAPAGLGV